MKAHGITDQARVVVAGDPFARAALQRASTEAGVMLLASWLTRKGYESLDHVVQEPLDENDEMLTLCGRPLPDHAVLEARMVRMPHDFGPSNLVCLRCGATKRWLEERHGLWEASFLCVPTSCDLCRERL